MTALSVKNELGMGEITGLGVSFSQEIRLREAVHFLMSPIGTFYGKSANRLLVHLLYSACLLFGVFLCMAITYGPALMARQLPLVCTLALHLVLVFSACHIISDALANGLWRGSMAYAKRKVGHQWLVLLTGLILGGYIHQASLPGLIARCAGWPGNPLAGLGSLAVNLSMVPLTCAALYMQLLLASISQGGQTSTQRLNSAMERMETGARPVKAEPRHETPSSGPRQLVLKDQGLEITIAAQAITHVSVEDHYCHVHYLHGQGVDKVMVRDSLQGLMRKLQPEGFVLVHRSHLVNQRHVAGLDKKGRRAWVVVGPGRVRLPLSRRRFRELKPRKDGGGIKLG